MNESLFHQLENVLSQKFKSTFDMEHHPWVKFECQDVPLRGWLTRAARGGHLYVLVKQSAFHQRMRYSVRPENLVHLDGPPSAEQEQFRQQWHQEQVARTAKKAQSAQQARQAIRGLAPGDFVACQRRANEKVYEYGTVTKVNRTRVLVRMQLDGRQYNWRAQWVFPVLKKAKPFATSAASAADLPALPSAPAQAPCATSGTNPPGGLSVYLGDDDEMDESWMDEDQQEPLTPKELQSFDQKAPAASSSAASTSAAAAALPPFSQHASSSSSSSPPRPPSSPVVASAMASVQRPVPGNQPKAVQRPVPGKASAQVPIPVPPPLKALEKLLGKRKEHQLPQLGVQPLQKQTKSELFRMSPAQLLAGKL